MMILVIKIFLKIQVKKFVRKRFVLEQLYNGQCVGCGKITIYDNLPALEIHHRNEELKTFAKWQEIANLDCEDILKLLINEDCVCLCSNCHVFIHSKYHNLIDEIISHESLNLDGEELCLLIKRTSRT